MWASQYLLCPPPPLVSDLKSGAEDGLVNKLDHSQEIDFMHLVKTGYLFTIYSAYIYCEASLLNPASRDILLQLCP